MSVDKIPVTQIWSLLDDKRKIDANNDQFISIPEALKTNPEELSSILRDATDDSVDPKKLANFMKNIFKRKSFIFLDILAFPGRKKSSHMMRNRKKVKRENGKISDENQKVIYFFYIVPVEVVDHGQS
jgi:hypothetical protein